MRKLSTWYYKVFNSRRKRFWLDVFTGTAFIFLLIASVLELFSKLNFLDPVEDALKDMEMTDLVFSRLRQQPEADTNIVLINIARLPRRGIAEQIRIINKYQPKVIGLDIFFDTPHVDDPQGDSLLTKALSEVDHLVMASKVVNYNAVNDSYDSLETSHSLFTKNAISGHANLTTEASHQDEYKSSRILMTKPLVQGKKELAFAIQLAKIYNPEATEDFLKRGKEKELINFRGNALGASGGFGNKFFALDYMSVLNEEFTPDLIENKVVIFGFMGEHFNDLSTVEDKFYTPLNAQYAGRALPDMFGAVIHANILAMIINRDYIEEMGTWVSIVLGIFLCFINVAFFCVIYQHLPKWYDGITKSIQLIEIVFLLFLIILIFHWFSYKINLTLGIASILLAGDALEFYFGVLKNIFSSTQKKQLFKKRGILKHFTKKTPS